MSPEQPSPNDQPTVPVTRIVPGPPGAQAVPEPDIGVTLDLRNHADAAGAPAGDGLNVPGYEVQGELGRGGMGVVYKARQHGLRRTVALKMILAGGHADQESLERFRTEAQAVARLQHPGIVQVYEVGEHQGLPFLSLEFCGGGSLAERLRGQPLPARQAAALVEKLARAIEHAHQHGIIHRDLKPANVLLAGPPPGPGCAPDLAEATPKITDFGLAKMLDARVGNEALTTAPVPGLTQTGMVMGTPSYMAPEQADGRARLVGPAADVYGLGAILYEMITGRPPFVGPSQVDTVLQVIGQDPLPPRLLNPQLDPDLEKITLKCLEKQPELRYASARALADDLRRYLDGEPITARSVNLLERLQRELAHNAHEAHLRPWGLGLILLGVFICCAHLATSLLLLARLPEVISFWLPRTVLLVLVVPLFVRFRPHASLWPTNAAERLIWAVWVGYLLTFLSLFWVMRILQHSHLHIYGVATAVGGLAWFAMGGHVWGGCYLIGAAFLLLAPLMALLAGSVWSPFCFGLLWGVALLILGGRYRRRGRESA